MEVMQKDSIDPRQKNAVNQVINPPELQALKKKISKLKNGLINLPIENNNLDK